MRVVPLTSYASQRFTFDMEGERIEFLVNYRSRTGVWTMDMIRDGEAILRGQRLLLGAELLRPFNFRLGGLAMLDTSKEDQDAGRDDLGSRVIMIHLTEAEIDAQVSP